MKAFLLVAQMMYEEKDRFSMMSMRVSRQKAYRHLGEGLNAARCKEIALCWHDLARHGSAISLRYTKGI